VKRVVLTVLAVVLLLVAAPLLIGGVACTARGAWGDPRFEVRLGTAESSGYAVVSDTLDVHWDVPFADRFDPMLGVRNTNAEHDVFIGYGTATSVDAYLSGVPYTLVYDIGGKARHDGQVDVPGSTVPKPPKAQDFWLTQADGPDLVAISFPAGQGSYRLVVMNADGSRGVDVALYGSISLPYLLPVGIGMLIVGTLLFVVAIALLIWGILSKPAQGRYGYGTATDAAPPPPHQSPESSFGTTRHPGAGPHHDPDQHPGAVSDGPAPEPQAPAPVHDGTLPPRTPPPPPAQPRSAPPETGHDAGPPT
jgi:hypothetical protein